MALIPPTVIELGNFREEPFAEGETARAEFVLQQSTDALWLFTGLEEYPSDPRSARITKYAIMDHTLWLMAQAEHRDEINSPFSGERIGSYSYTKMQQAAKGETTGIYWLDMLFRLLNSAQEGTTGPWATSERVFNPEGYTYAEQRAAERVEAFLSDPSEPWGFNL